MRRVNWNWCLIWLIGKVVEISSRERWWWHTSRKIQLVLNGWVTGWLPVTKNNHVVQMMMEEALSDNLTNAHYPLQFLASWDGQTFACSISTDRLADNYKRILLKIGRSIQAGKLVYWHYWFCCWWKVSIYLLEEPCL